MKSVEEQLTEKINTLKQRGLTTTADAIIASKDSIEKKLAECDKLLSAKESTRKHNGVGDNRGGASGNTSGVMKQKEALAQALQKQGFSEAEAKGIAGFPDDLRLQALVDAGVSTEDAFHSLVEAMRG